jgi:hypothetical protein
VSPRLAVVRWLAVVALAGGAASCSKKSKHTVSPEVSGLAAVPASAEVVVAADVARVIDAPLVQRAVDQLLSRDGGLSQRWQAMRERCKLEAKDIKRVVLAIGPHTGPQPGTGPVLMVATGKLVETDLAACVRAMVGEGGGTLTAKELDGHTLYQAKDGNRVMFFAFGRPDTVILGASEAFVTEALGAGKKVMDNPEMAQWIGMADQAAPLWAAGRVDERVKAGLVKATAGALKQGPTAIVAALDVTKGAQVSLGAIMSTPDDAKNLESFAKTQLGGLAMVAQAKSLGTIVDKLTIAADGNLVRFKLDLDPDEVNRLVSALDGGGGSAKDSPPPAGSDAPGP